MTTDNKNDLATIVEDVTVAINAAIAAGQVLLDANVAAALTGANAPTALNVFATMTDLPTVPTHLSPFYLGTVANLAGVEAVFVITAGRASTLGDFASALLTDPGGNHLLFATGAATWLSVLALV